MAHQSLFTGPMNIVVPAGESVSEPIPVRISDAVSNVSISCEARAKATVVVTLEGDHIESCSIDVSVGDEGNCTVICIGLSSSDVTATQRSTVGRGAVMQWQNVTLGSGNITHDLISRVIGEDGESAIDWMFYAKGSEKQNLTVRNIFDAPNGRGEILMRGISEEKGHASCKGLIDIGLKGGGTNTYLTQEVLMLDSSSKVDAVPALEIKTNDVKASHSATVARVTEEDLFYFGARGIEPKEARRMFVLGFLGDITGRIDDEAIRKNIIAAIEQKYER
jgi:Fe-S cluster assembly scaffold protein SufB